uniref:Kazal-like domain-containing protein n=1 Tax=Anopheles epiroticus TaxID=199890 RepID=A0A182P5F9_9DIPT
MQYVKIVLRRALVLSANAEPCGCPRTYRPVCGTDLKTYANQCILECRIDSNYGRKFGLKLLRDGPCKQEDVEDEN